MSMLGRRQARTRYYTGSFAQLANGGTITLRIRPQEPVWVRKIQGGSDAVNDNVDIQISIEDEQPFNTAPCRWPTIIGTAQLPMSLKAPWFINRYQTVLVTITNLTGTGLAGSVVLCCSPTWAIPQWETPKNVEWQLRTKLHVLRFPLVALAGQQTNNLRFDRRGYICAVQGNVLADGEADPGAVLVEYGFHSNETIVSNLTRWGSVVGTAQRPMWLPEPEPMDAQDSLSVTVQNQNGAYGVTPEIAFQFLPTGHQAFPAAYR